MKKIQYTVLTVTLLSLASGCATTKLGKNGITLNQVQETLVPDSLNQVNVDVSFNIPRNYISKRSRLFISPQIISNGAVREELVPIVLDASIYSKKGSRAKDLAAYQDPFAHLAKKVDVTCDLTIPFKQKIVVPEGGDCYIQAVISADGCGSCTGLQTILMADVTDPVTLIKDVKEEFKLSWLEPEFVIIPKHREGKGIAKLYFDINSSQINLEKRNNRSEMERMLTTLSNVTTDSLASLNSVSIIGLASADGSLPFNTRLSYSRANSAKEWLFGKLNTNMQMRKVFTVSSRPEGWLPVYELMVANKDADSLLVKNILEKYSAYDDDVQERYVRRLPIWNKIKEQYLNDTRIVEYVYTYTIKSFTTDEELVEMYQKRPDAFNEAELLRLASISKSVDEKKGVYSTLVKYFPQSSVAANNLAYLMLESGDAAKAKAIVEEQKNYTPELINTLAATYVYQNDYEKAIELLKSVDLPQARYNLGLIQAKRRKYQEAYELLKPFADVNTTIIALCLEKTDEAKQIADSIKSDEPTIEYVRAIIAARMDNENAFFNHIAKACQNVELLNRAIVDAEFSKYRGDERFLKLLSK